MQEKEEFELSSKFFKKAVENAIDSIVITGPDLDSPGPRIVYVNPAFTKMTGYGYSEAVGKSPRFLQGKNTDKDILRKVGRLLRRGKSVREEIINYRKDGSEYVIEWHIAPVFSKGKIINWVSIQRDITYRKQLEKAIIIEKASVEKKVKERTRQLEQLKHKLEDYAKKLEIRLSSIEKRQSGLSEREKRVLGALAANPAATDLDLSGLTAIKRPTVTSIKQRLRRQGYYITFYLPSHRPFIAELDYGELSPLEIRTRHMDERHRKQAVFYISSKTHYAALILHRDFRSAYNSTGQIFPGENMQLSFGSGLAELMGRKSELRSAGDLNDSEIARALVKKQDWSTKSIADMLGLSQATVQNAKNRLIEEGALRIDIIPKFRDFFPLALVHSETKISGIHPFIKAEGRKGFYYVGWTKDEDALLEEAQDSKVILFGRQPRVIIDFGKIFE
jgi:PAS domain S-box-containing protein